jgi:hypothetical protein
VRSSSARSRGRNRVPGGCALVASALAAAVLARASDAAAADDGSPPEEVIVLAPHRDTGETTVRRVDTRSLPGTFGDPTRFAETLPGMVPTASGLQAFFVRGAPPTSTGYFIDGVPVPALVHIGFGPSVIHPALIDRVEFFQGAPPARFGRVTGGVFAATTALPQASAHAEANVRTFDAGAFAETPLADGQGSALAAARYGYPGLILPLFAPDTGLSYWDYQARATWNASGRDRLSAFVFGSYDHLTQEQRDERGATYSAQLVSDQFHRVDLRWDRALGAGATMRLALTLGRDLVGDNVANAIDDLVRVRTEIDARPSRALRVRAGADVQFDALRPDTPPDHSPSPGALLAPSRDAVLAGAHADAAWRITPQVEVSPGLRADVYTTRNEPQPGARLTANVKPVVEPRLAVRVRVAPPVTVVSTAGVSHLLGGLAAQLPNATPFVQPGITAGLQSSVQMSQGVELALPASFFASATGFLHDYFGLPDSTSGCVVSPAPPPVECVTPTVDGRAYGLEVLVRRAFTERLAVWIAYTLSRSTRQARPENSDVPSMTILSEYDRTHVVSVVGSYDLGHSWRVGARLFAYSGRPYTAVVGTRPVVPYDSSRLPGFYRVDARLEKAWTFGGNRLALVLEGVNVTLNKEAVSATCGGPAQPAGPNACTIDTLGPITIPSIGLEGAFR